MAHTPRTVHSHLIDFFTTTLPLKPQDVTFLYHLHRHSLRPYDASLAPATHIVLSITPTAGVYAALHRIPRGSKPVCFLHRPWTLDRQALPRNTIVLASHKTFDELLTVGWNIPLASRLEFVVEEATCIQGYKGDPERKIGLLARSRDPKGFNVTELCNVIKNEYEGAGTLHTEISTSRIQVLAIMNAFHPEEVERVVSMTRETGWTSEPSGILYLTGEPRESGIGAAKALGMPVFCVGHRACEEWGIKYLGKELRRQFPGLQVTEVLEEEEPRPPRADVKQAATQAPTT